MGGGGSALRVCSDHRGGINWLSLSPDGQRLLTGTGGPATGQCCALLQGICELCLYPCFHTPVVKQPPLAVGSFGSREYRRKQELVLPPKGDSQALSPAGHESYVTFCQLEDGAAFTCSADCTIRRWDLHTGQCVQVYQGHTSIVNRILVANNQLFSSSYDRTARVWSVDKGQVSREFRGHRNCVLTLAYSAPWDAPLLDELGRTAFTGSTDATIRAWDILSGEQLRVFREHQGSIICLELVEQLLYSGSADRTVKCWLADAGQCVRTFPAHRRSVSALKFHAGTLFTGSGDACARAFDAQSGALQRVFRGHALVINCLQVHGHVLYTASHDGALRLWDLRGLQAPCPRPTGKRSLSRLFSNRVACVTAVPLQPT
ncbi:WD repeat-containing protein 86 [Heterocephalus glaber]|uniref:WD repeat-containing protein 86 n=1 Tax=Heterocephalus glaber TaxID=10181 RepID=G5AMU2_HETGA|nr:WD repeat-containing protein 86 [Heterocephalus glaber]